MEGSGIVGRKPTRRLKGVFDSIDRAKVIAGGSVDFPNHRTRVANFGFGCGRGVSWGPQSDARTQQSGTGAGRRRWAAKRAVIEKYM